MDKQTARKKIEKLREELEKHNYRYYVLSDPAISDFEYDLMMNDLIELEKRFPEFYSEYSPSQRVGDDTNREFNQVEHRFPMLSLGNTYSLEELKEFDSRIRKTIGENFEYICELKFDGTAIGLRYLNGILTHAVTRGDGIRGDDVTANVRTIRSIPMVLRGSEYPVDFEIRGEIFFPGEDFRKLNQERQESGESLFANPRNAAAGTLKMQNSSMVAKRPLDCYLYVLLGEKLPYPNHYDNLKKAIDWGFKISPHMEKCRDLDEVFHFINSWEKERKSLSFNIDGVVVKINSLQQQKQLGSTAKSPRWAISYKYKAEQAETQLLSIEYQVGRTGSITPVANLRPVYLAGTMVKRASLHNEDQIKLMDLHVNDMVYVEKGGEIIPKIVGVNKKERDPSNPPVEFISECPECKTPLVRFEGEANHYCPNEKGCPPQIKGRIEHFISRRAMDIDGLGEETIDLLFREGYLTDASDLYTLKKPQLVPLERLGEKSADRILSSIKNSKTIPFHRVLYALGIRYVGETVARTLAKNYTSIGDLMKADHSELVEINEIGERIAESLILYFSDPANKEMIDRLKNEGVQFQVDPSELVKRSDRLSGLTFVISGTFVQHSRDELKSMIEHHGGRNAGSVSGKTSFLLAGENTGPAKLQKARKLNIPIIDEKDFLAMLT
ncbi:MAG: NAD-dependent DNA ligase LigA [Bacteroidales bacterium]|nr:MAG: NAD-dependent DNA ligase LigA [Bacteroidales bacterium]